MFGHQTLHQAAALVQDRNASGTYNPDWAIVKEEDDKLYFVRETKGTTDLLELDEKERQKILCGKAHSDELDVEYKWVKSANEV